MLIYKCQHCDFTITPKMNDKKDKISAKHKMGEHYELKHKDLLPKDMTGYQWFYYLLTKKDHGSCIICHRLTDFNEATMKYSRFCNNPQCKQKYKESVDKNMIGKYGKVNILDDMEQQKKMLANRKISGTYTWSDGKTKIGYVGTYELDFLKFLDQELQWAASDIMAPSPHTYEYMCNGKKHLYIPDFYLPSLNLEIEIKSSIRMDKQNIDSRSKEIEKNKMMESCSNLFNYLIIYDKKYDELMKLLKEE